MWHYYIYYRVDAKDTHTLKILVASMQARLKCQTGMAGRFLTKRDDPLLWMEIYEGVENAEKFETALMQGVEQFEIEMFLADGSQRKIECFSDEC